MRAFSCFIALAVIAPGFPLRVAAQGIKRASATSLTLPAEAPQREYAAERLFPALSFDRPVAIVSPPRESNRLFIVEQAGLIKVVRDQAQPTATAFLDLRSRVGESSGGRGLLGMAFHPDYARNGHFYVWFTTETTAAAGTGRYHRLARFTVSASDPHVADPDSGQPLISQRDDAAGLHGGGLAFGPDGFLYVGVADAGTGAGMPPEAPALDRGLSAGILRIDVDGRAGSLPPNDHPAVHAGTYAIPQDNPFVGAARFHGAPLDPARVRTEFWATGLRNPRQLAFDPSSGALWVTDAGPGGRQEINLVSRGGDYGWPYRDGSAVGPRSPAPAGVALTGPEFVVEGGDAVLAGGIVYRDVQLSQIFGDFLFADAVAGDVFALRPDVSGTRRASRLAGGGGIGAFALNPRDGTIVLADRETGVLKRLSYGPAAAGPPFPETLSATGAFASLTPLVPAPGLVPYAPNASFWSDHALKRRWFALRDTTSTFGFSATGHWRLPVGAVWVKQFDLEMTRGDPATARRVETRFLVRTAGGIYGLSYRWNDAQTEATLVPESGASQSFTILEGGESRTQSWRFPSRSECRACHTPEGGYALSFNTRQLNRDHPDSDPPVNQLVALAQAGYLDAEPPAPATLPALVDPRDPGEQLEARARSYLDANCSSCHRPGGATAGRWDARAGTPLSLARLVNGPLTAPGSDPANRVLVPGDAAHSRIHQRMTATGGATRMPPIATREFDRAGEALIAAWIDALAEPRPPATLLNLSGRARVGSGPRVLIPGFVVQGGASRQVLVRAVGPGLQAFALEDLVPRPRLRLYAGGRLVGENAGWQAAANATEIRAAAERVGAFALNEDDADAAMLVTLEPGAYTAVIDDVDGSTGLGLFEVYDAQDASGARLVNTSVRAQVGSDAGVIIPGLVVGPGAFKKVLIRAVGPGLRALDVPGFLPAPVLTLYADSEAFLSNAGWGDAPDPGAVAAAAEQVGAFALEPGSADAALLVELSPGAYTLHVSSRDETAGIALVEVYEVP